MTTIPKSKKRWLTQIRLWWRRYGMSRKFAIAIAGAALLSGAATIATMTGSTAVGSEPHTVIALLYLDAVLLLLLGALVARRLGRLWTEKRRGHAGSGLHARLVMLFSLVAVTPAILVTIFSGVFLDFGLQSWFSERVSTALNASRVVARAYLAEHRESIISDALAMANDLNRNAPTVSQSEEDMIKFLTTMSQLRTLPEAAVIDGSGRIMARSALSLSLGFVEIPSRAIDQANTKGFVRLAVEEDDRVRVLVKLNRFVDTYLLVGRTIDPKVTEHIERTEGAVDQYQRLEKSRGDIQISFVLIFIVVALLVLMVSVWIGLTLATRLARPISSLVAASERVSKGDLSVRVENMASGDELGTLSRAFNRMTSQLEQQREGIMAANRQLDERQRFTQAVLSGVSAGVIGLDAEGRIHLPNRSASDLLTVDLDQHNGDKLQEIIPEMADLISNAMLRPDRLQQAEIKLMRNDHMTTLLVRIAGERTKDEVLGYVVTFDDVTELLSAQRKAAWADVARRIAHEIKNPLTPIQLSAERLKRKYLKEIQTDPETFKICTETIIRQVEDIGRMVNEFSSFARMPQPTLKLENLSDICRHAIFLEKNRVSDLEFKTDLPAEDIYIQCDSHQIGQAMTNLLKNASESILEQSKENRQNPTPGQITVSLTVKEGGEGTSVSVIIEDNGRGLPAKERDRLTEPYVTTRDKGTGLGLAIVKKIMEDHNGDLVLQDRPGGGAKATLLFRNADIKTHADIDKTQPTNDKDKDPMTVATGLNAHGS
ncbi:MAG: PAS domain-containing sensor histidine kinase [Rhodospirillales bacterium]